MSDTIKLSELLKAAGDQLKASAEDEKAFGLPKWGIEQEHQAKAIRSIAPALVDSLHTLLSQCPYSRARVACDCAGCALLAAMKEAGVSCD